MNSEPGPGGEAGVAIVELCGGASDDGTREVGWRRSTCSSRGAWCSSWGYSGSYWFVYVPNQGEKSDDEG